MNEIEDKSYNVLRYYPFGDSDMFLDVFISSKCTIPNHDFKNHADDCVDCRKKMNEVFNLIEYISDKYGELYDLP